MTPRPIPDPVASLPLLVVFCVASIAAFFFAGYELAGWLFDKFHGGNP